MGNLFGRRRNSPSASSRDNRAAKVQVTEHDKAVLQVKQQRDKIKQYQRRIEAELEHERSIAKKLLEAGKKQKALSLLRRKKYMERLLEKADGQLVNIENLIADLEFAQVQSNVVEGLKVGNQALKELHSVLSIDQIEAIMDETKDGIEKQREIDELILGTLTQEDEEGLEDELESMLQSFAPPQKVTPTKIPEKVVVAPENPEPVAAVPEKQAEEVLVQETAEIAEQVAEKVLTEEVKLPVVEPVSEPAVQVPELPTPREEEPVEEVVVELPSVPDVDPLTDEVKKKKEKTKPAEEKVALEAS